MRFTFGEKMQTSEDDDPGSGRHFLDKIIGFSCLDDCRFNDALADRIITWLGGGSHDYYVGSGTDVASVKVASQKVEQEH